MKKFLLIIALCIVYINQTNAQGCVAIRSTGGVCTMSHHSDSVTHAPTKWIFNAGTRYFKSYKHFKGKEEQIERVENGTEVINHSFTLDLSVVRNFSKRLSLYAGVPIISNSRSSLYEHGGKERKYTHSFGIGDARVAVNYWLIDPQKSKKFNVQAGLGIKLPTGDYRYQDYFGPDSAKLLGFVDQSIQLGDGGTGITAEMNLYYNLAKRLGVYGNFFYLANPREQNGVSTGRGKPASAANVANGSDVMSVPDQFLIRGGFNYAINKLVATAGVRMECVTVKDLIGGDNGFRRPGYVVSAEPGLTYAFKKVNAFLTVPIAIDRDRTQSVPDKITTTKTGVYRHGDAAFADYSINLGISVKL
ncbi:MAG: hypothetical protein V4717_22385 [Bacteroidota bacterium]